MTGERVCTHQVDGRDCGAPATDVEYLDQGRIELPRCGRHYMPPCTLFKGPEDP